MVELWPEPREFDYEGRSVLEHSLGVIDFSSWTASSPVLRQPLETGRASLGDCLSGSLSFGSAAVLGTWSTGNQDREGGRSPGEAQHNGLAACDSGEQTGDSGDL